MRQISKRVEMTKDEIESKLNGKTVLNKKTVIFII